MMHKAIVFAFWFSSDVCTFSINFEQFRKKVWNTNNWIMNQSWFKTYLITLYVLSTDSLLILFFELIFCCKKKYMISSNAACDESNYS